MHGVSWGLTAKFLADMIRELSLYGGMIYSTLHI